MKKQIIKSILLSLVSTSFLAAIAGKKYFVPQQSQEQQ